jgi:hypothetical protein
MLVISCQDVDALRELIVRGRESLLFLHLRGVQSQHIVVLPEGAVTDIRASASGDQSRKPGGVPVTRASQFLEAILKSDRVVRVKASVDGFANAQVSQMTSSSALYASAFISSGADVLIATRADVSRVRELLQEEERVVGVEEFPFTDMCGWAMRCSWSLKGRADQEVAERLLRPVVTWAKSITLIDRYAGRRLACIRDADESDDWLAGRQARYLAFFRLLLDTWSRVGRAEPWCGKLRLITERTGRCPPWQELSRIIKATMDSCIPCDAESSNRSISTVVELRTNVGHDRFLVTNMDVVVGFTRGFDFLVNGRCEACDVYVKREGEDAGTLPVKHALVSPMIGGSVQG